MTPTDLGTVVAGGASVVLAWVAAGVGGGIGLYLVFLGIRKGFQFFAALAEDRKAAAWFASAEGLAAAEEERIWSEAHDRQLAMADDLGWNVHDAFDSARVAGDLAVMEHRGEI